MLIDKSGRKITYLRISVTDRCNLNCVYCTLPEKNRDFSDGKLTRKDILSFEEIIFVCEVAKEKFSIKNLRLTGGEPILRKNLDVLVKKLCQKGFNISLTTNGTLLTDKTASALKKAGLVGINISMDTLSQDLYKEKTGGDIKDVLRGIESAERVGFKDIKINAVIDSGAKIEDALKFLEWSAQKGLIVKFIEEMPVGKPRRLSGETGGLDFSNFEKTITLKLGLSALEGKDKPGWGPARYYRAAESKNLVGFISAISHPFCDRCNRLRLTADGKLLPCLGHPDYVDIKNILRKSGVAPAQGAGNIETERLKQEIAQAFEKAAQMKPANHSGFKRAGCVNMISVGG